MLVLTSPADVARALSDPELDPDLRALLGRRTAKLKLDADGAGDDSRFAVVEGGDSPEVINDAVGFPITCEGAEEPSYEWIEDHGRWFELAYGRRHGVRTFIFVENGPGTESDVHLLCLGSFWSQRGEGGQ